MKPLKRATFIGSKPSMEELVHDPLFALGYAEVFRTHCPAYDIRWSTDEREVYRIGWWFGVHVKDSEQRFIRLMTRGAINPKILEHMPFALRLVVSA